MYISVRKNRKNLWYYLADKVKITGETKKEFTFPLGASEEIKEEAAKDPIGFLKHFLLDISDLRQKAKSAIPIPKLNGDELINLGMLYIFWFFRVFSLDQFLSIAQKRLKIQYSLDEIFKFMIGSRFLNPSSARFEYKMKGQWPVPVKFQEWDLYDAFSRINDLSDQIQLLLWIRSIHFIPQEGKDPLILIFDGTNFYTFSREPEEDLYDKDHNLIYKAYRTYGFSKENRPLPLVGIGLFVRVGGLPVEWSVQPGNRKESTYIPAELKKIMEIFRPLQFIFISDRGNWSGKIISTILGLDKESGASNFYIISRGLRQASEETQDWASNRKGEIGFKYVDDHGQERSIKLKARVINQPITFQNAQGKKVTLEVPQMEVVHYSASYARKEREKRNKKIKKVKAMEEGAGAATSQLNQGSLKLANITKDGQDVKKAKGRKVKVDKEKVAKEEKLDGFYMVTSNMVRKLPVYVYRQHKKQKYIEADFRILKTDFKLRPPYVWTTDHTKGFVDIDMMALYCLRFFQELLGKGFSADKILFDLAQFRAVKEDDGGYRILGTTETVERLAEITGIGFTHKFISRRELIEMFKPKDSWLDQICLERLRDKL